MKPILLLFTILAISFSSLSQEKQLDSLINLASNMKLDTNKILLMNNIAWDYKYTLPKKTKQLVEDIILQSKKIQFNSGTAQAYKTLGVLMDEAGNIPKSIQYYEIAIQYYKKLKDEMGIAKSEANIGILYRDMRRNKEAIEKFKSSNAIFISHDFYPGQLIIYQNLSICYGAIGKKDSALIFIKQAVKIMNDLGFEDPNVYGNYANIYLSTKNYPKAIEYYNKALQLKGDNHGEFTWIDNLGLAYFYQGQNEKALPYFLKSIANAPNIYTANTMATHRHLADVYYHLKEYQKAYQTQFQYIEIRDSIFSLENSKQLSELTKKYETEKKQIQITSLTAQRKAQDKQIKSEQRQKYFFAGGLIIFAVLGIFLFRLLRQKSKANKIILEQRNTLEHKNQEILASITYAKRLQDAILPAKDYWRNAFPESFVLYKPKDIVAGDFYWMEQVNNVNGDELLFFAAADCTGHGVPGAMVSVVCCNALNRSVLEFGLIDPGQILDKSRELVIATFEKSSENVMDGMDISLCCLNKNTLELNWAGANNPLWYNPKGTDELIEIKPNKQPIGSYMELKAFTTHSIILEKGTSIYLFTDGYADQFGGRDGKKFKYKQFKESILSNSKIDMSQQKENLTKTFERWKGDFEQVDDVCVIGIQV